MSGSYQSVGFEFATATRIIFGAGKVAQVPSIAAECGNRAFVLTGKSPDRGAFLVQAFEKHGMTVTTFPIEKEPTVEILLAAVEKARSANCDLVVGFGGGSVIDTGKAVAALLTNTGDLFDYLEVIGKAMPLLNPSAPYIAIPTTAGTGSEVTRNAVIGSPQHQVKVSMRSPFMLPRLAVIDPELMLSMPPSVTASTGLDALTQVIEPFVSNKANPLTDGICREGIVRAAKSLERAYSCPDDLEARQDMAIAGLFGGLALANAKLGAVHGFAGPLGGMIDAPHGVICARLLPWVLEKNVLALQERAPSSPVVARFEEVAQLLTGDGTATASDGVQWIQCLCTKLDVKPLSQFGLAEELVPRAVEKSKNSSSMKGNPIELTVEELTWILEQEL